MVGSTPAKLSIDLLTIKRCSSWGPTSPRHASSRYKSLSHNPPIALLLTTYTTENAAKFLRRRSTGRRPVNGAIIHTPPIAPQRASSPKSPRHHRGAHEHENRQRPAARIAGEYPAAERYGHLPGEETRDGFAGQRSKHPKSDFNCDEAEQAESEGLDIQHVVELMEYIFLPHDGVELHDMQRNRVSLSIYVGKHYITNFSRLSPGLD